MIELCPRALQMRSFVLKRSPELVRLSAKSRSVMKYGDKSHIVQLTETFK